MTQTFNCTACGAPNHAKAGTAHMACAYCGVNLTIPENLRTRAMPKVEKTSSKSKPVISLEKEAPDLIRQAQPIAIKAWNLYTVWTWIRWLLPTCLILVVVFFILCTVLGTLPFILNRF